MTDHNILSAGSCAFLKEKRNSLIFTGVYFYIVVITCYLSSDKSNKLFLKNVMSGKSLHK